MKSKGKRLGKLLSSLSKVHIKFKKEVFLWYFIHQPPQSNFCQHNYPSGCRVDSIGDIIHLYITEIKKIMFAKPSGEGVNTTKKNGMKWINEKQGNVYAKKG